MNSQVDNQSSTIANPRGNSSRLPVYLVLLFLVVYAYPDRLKCSHLEPFYTAPYSGEKVTEYTVTLPIAREQQQDYKIPSDCHKAQDALSRGASRWGNRVERRMWGKVRMDCDYARFLRSYPAQPLHDYVSGYDFMNAELEDISLWRDCTNSNKQPHQTDSCIQAGLFDNEVLSIFTARLDGKGTDEEKGRICRIENGIFRGRIFYDQTGVSCVRDNDNPAFRVIAIDYADVNGDDYLDAILRLIPLGRGMSRAPVILPLTRKEPDGIFTIPQNLPNTLPAP